MPQMAEQQSASLPSLPLTRKVVPKEPSAHERTPLLRKAVSFSLPRQEVGPHFHQPVYVSDSLKTVQRRPSAASIKSTRHHYGGQSTFGQTVRQPSISAYFQGSRIPSIVIQFNRYSVGYRNLVRAPSICLRWLGGWYLSYYFLWFSKLLHVRPILTQTNVSLIRASSAKILAKIMLSDPHLRSYSDIGRKAFGPSATLIVSIMFCLELFAVRLVVPVRKSVSCTNNQSV